MKIKKFLMSTFAFCFAANAVSFAAPAPQSDRETINQIALLQSLTLGHFDGSISAKNLKKLGDIGIGTFDGLNGEMIFLDGVIYRANGDCKINVVDDAETIPFSNVTFFDKDFSIKLENVSGKTAVEEKLNELVKKNGENNFYMVKIKGNFDEILVRSEKAAKKPYPTLVKALETQKEISQKNISGTIVGLYCPKFMSSLNSVGWHFHFVSEDKNFGGHVLEMKIKSCDAEFDNTAKFSMILPEDKDFQNLDLGKDLSKDIKKAENDTVSK
ncbi:MAG: acetolactate decarboxylase [Selenomonadaceae bacterium]|nr:acetolactate decarboxylase [Selenomonadaceae bacterium]